MVQPLSTYITGIVDLLTYAVPLVAGVFVCAYAVMFRYANKHNVQLEPFSMRLVLFFWAIDLPFKYSDAYRAKHGKMGPGIKLYLLGIVMFVTLWFCFAGLMLAEAIYGKST